MRASHIGDFLLAVPALRAIRNSLPLAEIVFIGLPRVQLLARRCQYITRFELFPGFPGIADQFYDARRTLAFLNRMQAEHFDLAVQMHGSGVYSNPFTLLLGARVTAGFTRPEDTGSGLDFGLVYPDQGYEIHRLLSLASFLGAAPCGDHLEFPLLAEDWAELVEWSELSGVHNDRPILAIHPGAEVKAKRWPADRFGLAGRELASHFALVPVVTGLAAERELTAEVAAIIGPRAIDLAGRLSLGGLGALLSRTRLLLTNDTATAHIAYALGTPSVTIFGPQDATRWGPLDPEGHRVVSHSVECRPCDHGRCPGDHRRMDGIGVAEVIQAAGALLTA